MKIAITGTGSGVGAALAAQLELHDVVHINRAQVDLSNVAGVQLFDMPPVDMLINCAATGTGGKVPFHQHDQTCVGNILNTNLIAPVLLSQKALEQNHNCKIVNITSTNNRQYWGNDLVYSLSKQALADFSEMLRVEYPNTCILEVRLGLTKTNFNVNRYRGFEDRFEELYNRPHLTADCVAEQICAILFDDRVKFIEIAP
jgi:short-subunit dehydrogenase